MSAYLQNILHTMQSAQREDRIPRLFESMLSEASRLSLELEHAARDGDVASAKLAAHTLKTAATMAECDNLAFLCVQLHLAAVNRRVEEISACGSSRRTCGSRPR